jgi:hypothetical protein
VKVGYRARFNEDDLSAFTTIDLRIGERHPSGEEFDVVLTMDGAREDVEPRATRWSQAMPVSSTSSR